MKVMELRTIEEWVPSGYKCDICGKHYDNSTEEGILELQEFHSICFTGGYGSVFGDYNHIECDICQYCLHEMIKDFCRTTDTFFDWERGIG